MSTRMREFSDKEHDKIVRAKQELEHAFDAVADLMVITDPGYNIVRVNRAMAERCGLTPMELAGRKCFEVMHGTDSPPANCPHAGLGEFQKPMTSDFVAGQLRGVFEITIYPVLNSDGQVTACVHIARDVAEKRHREELLATQQKQLEKLNSPLEYRVTEAVAKIRKKDDLLIQQSRLTTMGDLINSIAHHWRQPLNSIGLIVQGLQLAFKSNKLSVEELDAEIADTMGILQQISDTIDDFRTFFNHEKEPRPFSINDAVSRSINFVLPSLKCEGIQACCDEQVDISAVGYPNEYVQALLNIIINAKETLTALQGEERRISVRISEENGRSVVTVLDNGGGIDEDALPKIFDQYFTTRPECGGAGIGLYLAKMIIEKNMKGRLSARNVGGGAEFRIEV